MGRPKLALPLGGRIVLEHVVAAVRRGGVAEVLIVLGPHVAELEGPGRGAGARVLLLQEATADMRATVEAGLAWLEAQFAPRPEDRWLLVPADHPTLDPEVIRRLLAARAATECSVVVPTFAGRRGHPTLLDWRHAEAARTLPPGQGWNVYIRQCGSEVLEVPLETGAVLHDLDTPEDYDRLRELWPG